MCRKAHGSAFRARAGVKAAEFQLISGADLLTFYESSAGNHRGFCKRCGSPIVSRFDFDSEWVGLPLGALDDDPGIKPGLHVFVGSRAPWFEIKDDLPQYAEKP